MNPAVTAALSRIAEPAWTAIRYPQAVWDDDEQRWVSDAEVAEVPFTAFTGRRKAEHVPGRLMVRRVKRLQARSHQPGSGQQSEPLSRPRCKGRPRLRRCRTRRWRGRRWPSVSRLRTVTGTSVRRRSTSVIRAEQFDQAAAPDLDEAVTARRRHRRSWRAA